MFLTEGRIKVFQNIRGRKWRSFWAVHNVKKLQGTRGTEYRLKKHSAVFSADGCIDSFFLCVSLAESGEAGNQNPAGKGATSSNALLSHCSGRCRHCRGKCIRLWWRQRGRLFHSSQTKDQGGARANHEAGYRAVWGHCQPNYHWAHGEWDGTQVTWPVRVHSSQRAKSLQNGEADRSSTSKPNILLVSWFCC